MMLNLLADPQSAVDFGDIKTYCFAIGESVSLPEAVHLELRYVSSGRAFWNVQKRSMGVCPGDILISPRRHSGEIFVVKPGKQLQMYALTIPIHFLSGFEGMGDWWNTAKTLRRSRLAAECAAAMRDCHYEKIHGQPAWKSYVAARIQMLLVHFHRLILLRREYRGGEGARTDFGRVKIIRYLRTLDAASLYQETVENIAESLQMSPRRFSDLFRQITGTTWLKYLHEQKILRAKQLLVAKEDSISMIAFQAGFEDATTFHRVFKNYVGMTPNEWRYQQRDAVTAAT